MERYLDGEADAASAGVIARHLADCWSCSEDAEWLLLVKTALGRLGERHPLDLAVARLARYASALPKRC